MKLLKSAGNFLIGFGAIVVLIPIGILLILFMVNGCFDYIDDEPTLN